MNRSLRILSTQARYAMVVASRNPSVIFFGIVFPVFLLVLFNSIFGTGKDATTTFSAGRIESKAYFTAGMVAYAITLQTFSSLAISITTLRETGQLKRLRGTPMPAWTFVGAYVLRSIVFVVAMVVVLFAVGVIFFGVHLRGTGIVGIAIYVALGTAALTTLGVAITSVTRTADSAGTVGPFTAVILSFISGIFIPVETLPNWLESIGKVFPLAHLADGLQRAVAAGGGTGLNATDVIVLAAWGLGGLILAARRFRWEPQTVRA